MRNVQVRQKQIAEHANGIGETKKALRLRPKVEMGIVRAGDDLWLDQANV